MNENLCRRRADDLWRRVGQTSDLEGRMRLIEEAMHWHNQAIVAQHQRRLGDVPGSLSLRW